MRKAAAAVLAVVALGGAVYFVSLRLETHRTNPVCSPNGNGVLGLLDCSEPASRAVWQFPVAVVIAALGLVGAVGVLKRTY